MNHRYDPNCYCFDCCDTEERIKAQAKRDKEAEAYNKYKFEARYELALSLIPSETK